MSDLAKFVSAVLVDKVVAELLQENQQLQEKLEAMRTGFIKVLVRWAAPVTPEDREEIGDMYEFDSDGFVIFDDMSRVVVLSSETENGHSVQLGPRGGFYPIEFDLFLQSEMRFGEFPPIPMNNFSFSYYVGMIRRDEERGQLEFTLYLNVEFVDLDSGRTITIVDLEVHLVDVSMEQYAELSGLSHQQIESKFNMEELEVVWNQADDVPAFQRQFEWICLATINRSDNPTRVETGDLQRVFGHDFLLAVSEIDIPLDLIKKKCHLL